MGKRLGWKDGKMVNGRSAERTNEKTTKSFQKIYCPGKVLE